MVWITFIVLIIPLGIAIFSLAAAIYENNKFVDELLNNKSNE